MFGGRGPEIEELGWAFRKVFGKRGREFGNTSHRIRGFSDGNEGVQWNAWTDRGRDEDWAGVNLEGMRYDGWPVARLILRELKEATLPAVARSIEGAERIEVLWARDFWQRSARPRIVEGEIHPTPIPLSRLGEEDWRLALEGALACLDESRGYQGRAKQQVTVVSREGNRRRGGEVSPHLTFRTPMEGPHSWESFLREAKSRMRPLYDWAVERSAPAA